MLRDFQRPVLHLVEFFSGGEGKRIKGGRIHTHALFVQDVDIGLRGS